MNLSQSYCIVFKTNFSFLKAVWIFKRNLYLLLGLVILVCSQLKIIPKIDTHKTVHRPLHKGVKNMFLSNSGIYCPILEFTVINDTDTKCQSSAVAEISDSAMAQQKS